MKLSILIGAIVGSVILSTTSFGEEPAKVSIHLLERQILGDTSVLDRSKYFNVHSSYTAPALTKADLEQLKELNVGFGRAFDGPFSGHKNGTPYPDTETIKAAAAAVIAKAKADPLFSYRTTRRLTTSSVRDTFNMQDDPAEMARYAADILEFNYEDDFRPDFYAPMSIPFVAANKYGEDQAEVRKRMTALFAEVGKEIDRRGLSTKIIGYTSAWPMMHFWDFGHWRERMQMFMDIAGPHMDGICFLQLDATHMQEEDSRRSGSRVEALMDLIETYGAIKWGTPKPHAVSEYGDVSHGWPMGDTYTPARSSAELNSYNHFLFSLLGRQDRLLFAIPFLTTKSPWHYNNPKNNWQPFSADLWRPDAESIVNGTPTRFIETEKMEFYRLWRDVKGHRVFTESSDPDVVTYAFVDESNAFVCLNNFEDEQREVVLSLPDGLPQLETMSLKRMFVPKQQAVIYTKKAISGVPEKLVMEPHETIILHVTYAKPLTPFSVVKTKSYYSKDFLRHITADQSIVFTINDVTANDQTTASLRIGLAREHDLSKTPQLNINGHEIELPVDWVGYDQSNKKNGFFGAIVVPVPEGILMAKNSISLTFPDGGGRVSTVVLEVNVPEN